MGLADTFPRFRSAAAATLLVAVLVIGALQSLRFLWNEARQRPLEFRRQALTADAEERYRLTLGRDYDLYRLLRQRLGPSSILAVRTSSFAEYTTRTRLEPLLYPVAVVEVGELAPASAARDGADLYLLNLSADCPASLPPGVELMASSSYDASSFGDAGSAFALWKMTPGVPLSAEFGEAMCSPQRRRG